jgi:FHS family L-fucose permease-like MFS transporter
MAVVGEAIIPLVTGGLADRVGLNKALPLPAICYVGIAAFASVCTGFGIIDRRSA